MSSTHFPTREGTSPSESLRFSIGVDKSFEMFLDQLGAIGTPLHIEETESKNSDPRILPTSSSQARSVKVSTAAAAV